MSIFVYALLAKDLKITQSSNNTTEEYVTTEQVHE